jgi:hypothetical protein
MDWRLVSSSWQHQQPQQPERAEAIFMNRALAAAVRVILPGAAGRCWPTKQVAIKCRTHLKRSGGRVDALGPFFVRPLPGHFFDRFLDGRFELWQLSVFPL